MKYKHVLGIMDYIVIAFSLLVSVLISIKFQFSAGRQRTMREYLMAGKDMPTLPVVMSICVTMLSAITMIGAPIETYRYGTQACITFVGSFLGLFITTRIFIPVYFKCGVSSIYEFLEIRYGKTTRYVVSGLFILQMVFFMSSVLYAPVLAICAVTNLSVEISIIVFGLVCSFYCVIGGLKAVMWTDVFQAFSMMTCLIALYIKGINEAGGVSQIYKVSQAGQRLEFFNSKFDLNTRYTFWNVMFRSTFVSMAYFGTNQMEVQRFLSLSTINRAQSALLWSYFPFTLLLLMCQLLGLVFYSIFYTCDPIQDKQNTGVTRYDQMVPYYIVSRFSWIPGLTGVCVAGIFSGSLSSLSSALNSLSTVTVVDFIKPLCPTKLLTETRTIYIAKFLSLLYGVICIAFTFAISKADSLVALANTLVSIMEGPVLAIFLVGVLTRKGSEKCILFAILFGVTVSSWIGYGSIFSGYRYPSLPLNSTGCPGVNTSYLHPNSTIGYFTEKSLRNTTSMLSPSKDPFFLYTISYVWLLVIGCCITLCLILLAILVTGWSHNAIPADSKCLCPAASWWIGKLSGDKTLEHNEDEFLEERTKLTVWVKTQEE